MGILANSRHEQFAHAVAKGENATAAYIAAGYSPNGAQQSSAKLLLKAVITARIAEIQANIAVVAQEKTGVAEARVIEEAARIGLLDPARLFDAKGNLLPIHDIPPEVRAAISSIEVDEVEIDGEVTTRVKKVKLWDKNSAIEKLMRHLGSFERDNKQKAGLFDSIPRDTLEMIEGKLRAIAGMAEQSDARSGSRFTH